MSCLICRTVDIINGPLCTFMKRPPHISGTVTDIALPHREPYTAFRNYYYVQLEVTKERNVYLIFKRYRDLKQLNIERGKKYTFYGRCMHTIDGTEFMFNIGRCELLLI